MGRRHALCERAVADPADAGGSHQGHSRRLRQHAGAGREHLHEDPEPAEGPGPRHEQRGHDARVHGGGPGHGEQARLRRHERRICKVLRHAGSAE